MENEFQIEKRLKQLDPDLHSRYRSTVVLANSMLNRYKKTFWSYTDHSIFHTMIIIDRCNCLVGDQLDRLTADDLYVMLMGALLHDVGMGMSREEFDRFFPNVKTTGPVEINSDEERAKTLRNYHEEFSGMFVEHYAEFLDIPGPAYTFAVAQACRGHRRLDLLDERLYPAVYEVAPGRVVHLSYIGALLRIADELDIAADRNIALLFTSKELEDPLSKYAFRLNEAISQVIFKPDEILVTGQTDADFVPEVQKMIDKVQQQLTYCCAVVRNRSDFTIRQENVRLELTITPAEA